MASKTIELGQKALLLEAEALRTASGRLGSSFEQAVEVILKIKGRLVCTGLGKSGHVARKISATLSSTGTRSLFLHPSEGLHGDLGMIGEEDALLAVAYGGETAEVLEIARFALRLGLPIISITGKLDSTLAKLSTYTIDGSVTQEVCPNNLAPTSSSTLALALGDALAVCLMDKRGFKAEDFAQLHPSGSLGRKLKTVQELMTRSFAKVEPDVTFAELLEAMHEFNHGLVAVCDPESPSHIIGIVTDGDLRRAVRSYQEKVFTLRAKELMTSNPKSISASSLALSAVKKMEDYKNTALFVEAEGSSQLRQVIGLIRMHDLVEAKII